MIGTARQHRRKSLIVRLAIGSFLVLGVVSSFACGNDSQESTLNRADFEIVGRDSNAENTPTPAPAPASVEDAPTEEREVQVLNADGDYSVAQFEHLANFKLSKTYDVEELPGATAAIYGFFGPDPYDRKEYEARIYPDHATALSDGVDFAIEATGSSAVIASSKQRWDEGLSQRRTCAANVRGSHHSGRCDLAKYGDYVVAGNLVLLCQGRDSASALKNCEALYTALQ